MRRLGLLVVGVGALAGAATGASSGVGAVRCPVRHLAPVASSRAGATSQLVPPGAQALLLCRYARLGSDRLVAQRTIGSANTVSQLAGELNALPQTSGAYSCPADFSEDIVGYFGYASGPDDPVTVDLTGCNPVTNGSVNRLGLDRPVIRQLAALVPLPGTLQGHIELCGGPAPGRCRVSSFGACDGSRCWEADRVAILDSAGRQVADPRVRRGRFTAQLAPGRYKLRLLGDGKRVHGKTIETARATVRSSHTTTVSFPISVP